MSRKRHTSRLIVSFFAQISLLESFRMYEDEYEKKNKRNIIIIELCESYDANNKRQARDELVVMMRATTKNEMRRDDFFR